MPNRNFPIFGCILLLSATLAFSATITYQEDTTNFPNPERGYYDSATSYTGLINARSQGKTLIRRYYRLDDYINTDTLPQSLFLSIINNASTLRQAGAKMIPRFSYNFGACTDPPLSRILRHIEQLTPVLSASSDVIAFFEAGFIGKWGEWHHSGCTDPSALDNTAARTAVLTKLLDAVPDRMVALRYNFHKRDIFGQTPLDSVSAFGRSNAARTGNHNDCFVASADDVGSFQGPDGVEWQKTWLNKDNRFVVQGGESCEPSPFSACSNALVDFKRMHWDVINILYKRDVISSWMSGGCHSEIQKLLGYRLKMINARLQDAVRPGNPFSGTIKLINLGWGKIYNYRGCELVFRNTSTNSKFSVTLSNDPRRWCMTDSPVAVNISAWIPGSTAEGLYKVYLNLPDTANRLYGKPAFSIRLANTGVWEDSTGYNSLLHTVSISRTASIRPQDFNRSTSEFSFSVRRKNQTFTISIQSPESAGPVAIEIFTNSGRRLAYREIERGQDNRFFYSWTGPSRSCFLVRVRQGDRYRGMYTIF